MGIISEVKCGRCDRRYSGFRSRCPYCGARRNKRGKHANDSDNAKAKLVIGTLLMLVLIAAAMVLIISSLPPKDGTDQNMNVSESPADTSNEEPANVTDDGVVEEPGTSASVEPSPPESPTPDESEIPVESVKITYAGVETTDFTLAHIGDSEKLRYQTVPAETTAEPEWKSSDESVFMIVENENGVKVSAVGSGVATLTVTIDGKSAECTVRVK